MENDDMPDKKLQNYLRKAYATNAKEMNKSLRGSSEEYVPMVIPMNIGGMNYLAHPIGAGESGSGFLDYLPLPLRLPIMMAKAVANKVVDKVSGGADRENTYELPPPHKVVKQANKTWSVPYAVANEPTPPVFAVAQLVEPGTPHNSVNQQLNHTTVAQGPATFEVPNEHLETQNGVAYAMPLRGSGKKQRAKKGKKGGSLLSTIGNVANMFGLPKTPLEEIAGPELTKKFKEVGYDLIGKQLGLGKPKKATKQSANGPKKANPWLVHVKDVKAKNPAKSFKEVLQLAKLSYKK